MADPSNPTLWDSPFADIVQGKQGKRKLVRPASVGRRCMDKTNQGSASGPATAGPGDGTPACWLLECWV